MTAESTSRSERGVYGISVASELTGLSQQTLRLYEQRGLLKPVRTQGNTRRYSDADLDRVRQIAELVSTGINLPGIARILDLETQNSELQANNEKLHRAARADPADQPSEESLSR